MKHLFWAFTFMIMFLGSRAMAACDYYASPSGGGDGSSSSSPFKIANFWSVASAGRTLCLLDGTYYGQDSMINPTIGLSGMSGAPVTVKALNDGGVLLDGQYSSAPVRFNSNNYFVIEGINACHSSGSVYNFYQSKNNILRRVTGWDANEGNHVIFELSSASSNNLIEDAAGWGLAGKIVEPIGDSNNNTFRRVWARWDGYHTVGPKMAFSMAYNSYGSVCENCIGSWSGAAMKESYTLLCPSGASYSGCGRTYSDYAVDQPQGIITNDGYYPGLTRSSNVKVLGSITYVRPEARFPYGYANLFIRMDNMEIADMVSYFTPGYFPDKANFGFANMDDGYPQIANDVARNITGIGGRGYSWAAPEWQIRNMVESGSLSSLYSSGENLFNTSRGANLCHRYENKARTSTPLWPWPMDQRIKAAMAISGHRSVTYGMANNNGLVTTAIEEMFGAIPSSCRTSGGTTPPPVISPKISVSSTQVLPGAKVTVNVSGATDPGAWVGLFVATNPDSAYSVNGNWQYLNGTKSQPSSALSSATLTFIVPTNPGVYNLRFFASPGINSRLVVSANVTVSEPPPAASISVSATQIQPGQLIKVSVSGAFDSNAWVALYDAANPDSSYSYNGNWQYLNGSKTAPASNLSSATLSFVMPSGSGIYNFRFFAGNGIANRLAMSPNVTVAQSTFSISGKVLVGTLGLAGATVSAGGKSVISASDGTYSIGALSAGTYSVAATKSGYSMSLQQTVSVGPNASSINFAATLLPNVLVSATQVQPGATVTVSVSGGFGGAQEWVALYNAANLDSAYSFSGNWQYLNGTKIAPLTGLNSATLTFVMPTTPGTYNFRYFAYNGIASRLAVSFTVTVVQPGS